MTDDIKNQFQKIVDEITCFDVNDALLEFIEVMRMYKDEEIDLLNFEKMMNAVKLCKKDMVRSAWDGKKLQHGITEFDYKERNIQEKIQSNDINIPKVIKFSSYEITSYNSKK